MGERTKLNSSKFACFKWLYVLNFAFDENDSGMYQTG